jgi:hypothetical protein
MLTLVGQELGKVESVLVAAADNEIAKAVFRVYRKVEDQLHEFSPCSLSAASVFRLSPD